MYILLENVDICTIFYINGTGLGEINIAGFKNSKNTKNYISHVSTECHSSVLLSPAPALSSQRSAPCLCVDLLWEHPQYDTNVQRHRLMELCTKLQVFPSHIAQEPGGGAAPYTECQVTQHSHRYQCEQRGFKAGTSMCCCLGAGGSKGAVEFRFILRDVGLKSKTIHKSSNYRVKSFIFSVIMWNDPEKVLDTWRKWETVATEELITFRMFRPARVLTMNWKSIKYSVLTIITRF